MRKIVCTILTLILYLLVFMPQADGQIGFFENRPLDEPRFDIDLAAFKTAEEDKVELEVYYKIYNDGLKFFKQDDDFVAHYEINVVILGEDNRQLTGTSVERYYKLSNYPDTRNPNDFLINLVNLKVGKGKFKLVCKLIDKHSEKISPIEREFEIQRLFDKKTDISSIEFIRETLPLDSIPTRFDKGEKRIIPAVTRVYGADIKQVSFYVELYHEADKSFDGKLIFNIENKQGKEKYEDKFEVTLDKPITRFIKHISLEDLLPDDYTLQIDLENNRGKEISTTSADFTIEWSLEALIRNDFDLAVEMLKFVARQDDLDKLRDAEPEDRLEAFEEFWKEHDPTPATPENELRMKYYQRIKDANRLFSSIHRKGWRTDMGMIYIIYGEPEQVESHPFELNSKPYQIWYYYSLSRTFVFVDEIGTGDYELQYPYDGRRGFIDDRIDDYD